MSARDLPEVLPWNRPRPKWPKRLLIASLILVPLCLVVPFVYFLVSGHQALQQAFAEADRLDPGWLIPELEQQRTRVPAAENSGPVILAAKGLMPPNWPFWYHPQAPEKGERSEQELQILQESLENLKPTVQLDERQMSALRQEVQRAAKALAVLRKVADLPHGRYSIVYTRDFVSTLLPHVQVAREMGNLLAYDVLLRAQKEDAEGAIASCHGILNCGRSLGDEPTLISMLVRIALNHLAIERMEWILSQGQPSEAALSAMQRALEEEAAQPLLLIGARGERGLTDGAMQAIQDGDLDPRFYAGLVGPGGGPRVNGSEQLLRLPGMANGIRAALLKHNNQFVEIAKLPVEEQVVRIQQLQATTEELPELARALSIIVLKAAGAFHRDQAELRCAVVMIAVERYRRANHRWPDTLSDLVPAFLPNMPLDPFDGKPLRYRRLDDGVVIYSISSDGKDDGGKFEKDPAKAGSDLGVRLWDVPQRRRPPKRPPNVPLDENP